MGTNYYLQVDDVCPSCGASKKRLHIGKSSAGWCFSLHVIPEKGLNTLSDWRERWSKSRILDEYGRGISVTEIENIITNRSCPVRNIPFGGDYYSANSAEPGPNGLLRYKVDGYCVGHGEGTWDYILGEFS